MKNFFDGMSTFEETYWIVALIGSAVFAVFFIMAFIGADSDADMDADADSDADDGGIGFQFFSFKNIAAFFTMFGWSGVSCIDNGCSTLLTLIISSLVGLLMMVLISSLFYWIHKLAESGTLKMTNAIGAIGEVYLPIGAKRSGIGKISIKVQGSLRELEALTDSLEDLKTGTVVKVLEVISAELLLVEKLAE